MQAYASVSGGVIFVPEKVERKSKSISYSDFIEEQNQSEKPASFGRRRAAEKQDLSKAA